MKILGIEMNSYFICLNSLILVDLLLITISMVFSIPMDISLSIQLFDFIVCLILIADWIFNLYLSSPKSDYLKDKGNILGLIASIPFDVLLPWIIPGIGFLRYLRLLKLVRIILMVTKFHNSIKVFFDKTNLHKILGGLVLTILIFTVLLWLFGPSYNAFDDLYFVIVTLTTVGYGDVTPKTYNEKVLSLILILIGIFVFSTITAAISSYLTDRLLDEEDEELEDNIQNIVHKNSENIIEELKIVRDENNELREEIHELKELFDNKME